MRCWPMSESGQTRSFGDVRSMSGLPPTAAVQWTFRNGGFVPKPAVSSRSKQRDYSNHLVGAGEQRLLSELVPNVTVAFEQVNAADYFRAFASASSFSSWLIRSCSADR